MKIEKINFSYPRGSLQSVYDTEAMTALELASKTSKKVDEVIDLVEGVSNVAEESQNIVADMQLLQENFLTDTNNLRSNLLSENQDFISVLSDSKGEFVADLNSQVAGFLYDANQNITTGVENKINDLMADGTFTDLISDEILQAVSSTEKTISEISPAGIVYGFKVTAKTTPNMTVLVENGVIHHYDGKRFEPGQNITLAVSPADSTYPRIDAVYISQTGAILMAKGTPDPMPIMPRPYKGIVLASILVNKNVTAILNEYITDKRKYTITTQDLNERIDEEKRIAYSVAVNALYPFDEFEEYRLDSAGNIDCTDNLNALMYILMGRGGGNIYLPAGTYKFEGTLHLQENVALTGSGQATILTHMPTTAGQGEFMDCFDDNFTIKNMIIQGNGFSDACLLLEGHNFNMENVRIFGFNAGIQIRSSNRSTFKRVTVELCRSTCLRMFEGGNSRGVVFENCYFYNSPLPAIFEKESSYGTTFKGYTSFVDHEQGFDIYTGNVLNFQDCYVSNVPSSSTPTAMFNLGINGTDEATGYSRGICTVTGGFYSGYSGNNPAGSAIFNVDRWATLTVTGARFSKAHNTILTTAKTKICTFISCVEFLITNNLTTPTQKKGINIIGSNANGVTQKGLSTPEINFNQQSKWKIRETFYLHDGDLLFENGGVIPLYLDGKNNIRINYTEQAGTTEKAVLIGGVTRPSFTGMETAYALWCENIPNLGTHLLGRSTTGGIYPVSQISGTTANRPTALLTAGSMYFDTTLGKAIFRRNTGWVDALGNVV